jgi:hypothetical protein
MFMGIDGYLEGKKEEFIKKELVFYEYEVKTDKYIGKFSFSLSTRCLNFSKESLYEILNIIY